MRNPTPRIESVSSTGWFKSAVVAAAITLILSFLIAIVAKIIGLLAQIVGLKIGSKIKDNEIAKVSEGFKTLPKADVDVFEKGTVAKDKITPLREKVVAYLMDKGLKRSLSEAAASHKDRLVWDKPDWDRLASNVNKLLEDGVEEDALDTHLRMVSYTPTFTTVEVLYALIELECTDPLHLIKIMTQKPSLEDLEYIRSKVEGDGMPWSLVVERFTAGLA